MHKHQNSREVRENASLNIFQLKSHSVQFGCNLKAILSNSCCPMWILPLHAHSSSSNNYQLCLCPFSNHYPACTYMCTVDWTSCATKLVCQPVNENHSNRQAKQLTTPTYTEQLLCALASKSGWRGSILCNSSISYQKSLNCLQTQTAIHQTVHKTASKWSLPFKNVCSTWSLQFQVWMSVGQVLSWAPLVLTIDWFSVR